MGDLWSRLTYLFSTIAGSFSGLVFYLSTFSLYEWVSLVGLVGVIMSIAISLLTYRLHKREQMKRTRIIERYFNRHDVTEKDIKNIVKASAQSPKDI